MIDSVPTSLLRTVKLTSIFIANVNRQIGEMAYLSRD